MRVIKLAAVLFLLFPLPINAQGLQDALGSTRGDFDKQFNQSARERAERDRQRQLTRPVAPSCFYIQGDFTGGPQYANRINITGPSNVTISEMGNSSSMMVCPNVGNGAGTYNYTIRTQGWDNVCSGSIRASGNKNVLINVYYSSCSVGYVREF